MRLVVVRVAFGLAAPLVLNACGYGTSFRDCEVSCTSADVCPSGLTCGSEGLCRTAGATAACSAIISDGGAGEDTGPCLSYFDDATAFATSTSSLNLSVEDFSRTADESATPDAFVIQSGSYFFYSNRVTFATLGVNDAPGTQANSIAVGGSTAPNPTTIMSQLTNTARDAIVASFTTNVTAVAFAPSDDQGSQSYTFDVVTASGSTSFPVASAQMPFVGVVSSCGPVITTAALSPPVPSQWWRLYSVTFGP